MTSITKKPVSNSVVYSNSFGVDGLVIKPNSYEYVVLSDAITNIEMPNIDDVPLGFRLIFRNNTFNTVVVRQFDGQPFYIPIEFVGDTNILAISILILVRYSDGWAVVSNSESNA